MTNSKESIPMDQETSAAVLKALKQANALLGRVPGKYFSQRDLRIINNFLDVIAKAEGA